ncbi:PREDICTED: uncharacterized protein LOC107345248 [Acropora digitifera]|uniref:uncharacterized protein LOC107345248 n=1 Tax=Acropora digitifera TaxID=70779 RepID=UPI00077A9737|nr:PREDICTED: uncharacterized protein LOC107345248 [Acropora digitifera]
MSEFGKDEKDPQPTDEEKQRPISSLSSIMSRTSSPAQLQDDVLQEETCVTREENLAGIEVSTGYLSADVSAREMVQGRAFSASPCVRVMLRENSELEIDNSETSLKTAEDGQGSEQAGEGLDHTPGEVYFFNKKSTARRVKQITHKLSGQERCSAKLRPVDTQGDPDNVEQNIMNLRQKPDESPKLKQTEYSERNSPTHLPFSTSSSSPVEEEVQENTKREKTRANSSNATTELVSVFTQTEWSWFNDMLQYQEMMTKAEKAVRTKEIPNSPSAHSHTSSIRTWRRRSVGSRRTSVSSEKAALTKDEDNLSLPDVEEGQETKQNFVGFEEGGTGRRKSRSSGGISKSRQSFASSLPQTPKGEDTLFRPTTVEPDTSSDSEDDENYEFEREYLLPSIGPPAILQYLKESQHPPMSNEQIEDREELSKNEMLKKSMFSGPCMFCQEEVLPFPSVEELENLNLFQLFCCPQYERLVKFELAQRGDSGHLVDEMIDIKPHPPYGTKAARRAAKERAAARAREREMERQRAAGANPLNFYALTRQMKTITYSLSSTKCMEEGWTVRPQSPSAKSMEDTQDKFVIEVNPLPLVSKSIDDDDTESNPSKMLAIFEPSGHATSYFKDGSIRLVLNPFFGVLLDKRGTRKKKWLWHNLKEHVHAPPFQPVTFTITKELSLRCLSQNKTVLTFSHGKYTARFNVGAKLKAIAKVKAPSDRENYETHLAEVKQFVKIILDRYQNAMRLPKYPRLDKIPLPHHLQRERDAMSRARQQESTSSGQQETTVVVN